MSVRIRIPEPEPNTQTHETKKKEREKKKMNGKDDTYDKLMWATASVLVDAEHEHIHKPNGNNSEQIPECMINQLINTVSWLHYHNVIDGNGFMNYIKEFVESHKGIYNGNVPTLKEN